MLKKIISSGQTGVDQAALDSAIRMGIPYDGWIDHTEHDVAVEKYQLHEITTGSNTNFIEKNVKESDGTLIISRGTSTNRINFTREMLIKYKKQMLHIDLTLHRNLLEAAFMVSSWIKIKKIKILNVTGPQATEDANIYIEALAILMQIMRGWRHHQYNKDTVQPLQQLQYCG